MARLHNAAQAIFGLPGIFKRKGLLMTDAGRKPQDPGTKPQDPGTKRQFQGQPLVLNPKIKTLKKSQITQRRLWFKSKQVYSLMTSSKAEVK